METAYDWATVLCFAGLVVLFLQRSSMESPPDRIHHYIPPAVLLAFANYAGNDQQDALAIGAIVLAAAYTFFVLNPLKGS